jgi:Raf kinase inhibitor-like YbhB/YbcL family protein
MTARTILVFAATLFASLISGCSRDVQPAPEDNDMRVQLASTAFTGGQPIPRKYTGRGNDISPPLQWTATSTLPQRSAQIKSFALICDDPDAPMGTFTHWVIYNLPPTANSLAENISKTETLPDGSKQGRNSFGNLGYNGPAPPPGKPHRYYYRLYALDTVLNPGPGVDKRALLNAMNGHVLATGELMGTFQSP